MTPPTVYHYLVRARRDLWAALTSAGDALLSRPLLDGDRFHSIRDLVLHIPDVEDGWINGDILQGTPVQKRNPAFRAIAETDFPIRADLSLDTILSYWRAVEQNTLAVLPQLLGEPERIVPGDNPAQQLSVDSLLWHVMLHEIRHTAQICVLLRSQHVQPPSLDLLFYLPVD